MKEYIKESHIKPCRLYKTDLEILVSYIKEGVFDSKKKEDFEISTYLPTVNISEHDLQDFLDHDELPKVFKKLIIEQKGWNSNNEIDRVVSITFYDNFINLSVRGDKEEWVLGKYIKIEQFLDSKKTKFWFLNYKPELWGMIQGVLFGIAFTLVIYFIVDLIENNRANYFLLLCAITIFIFSLSLNRLPYIEILIAPKEKKYLNRRNITLFIAIINLIAVIVFGIVQLAR